MAARKRYRVLRGINYPGPKGEVRAEPGDIVDDLPTGAIDRLLSKRAIMPVEPATAPVSTTGGV